MIIDDFLKINKIMYNLSFYPVHEKLSKQFIHFFLYDNLHTNINVRRGR